MQVKDRSLPIENKQVPRYGFLKILQVFEFRYGFVDSLVSQNALCDEGKKARAKHANMLAKPVSKWLGLNLNP
jgi:hypothetical protein